MAPTRRASPRHLPARRALRLRRFCLCLRAGAESYCTGSHLCHPESPQALARASSPAPHRLPTEPHAATRPLEAQPLLLLHQLHSAAAPLAPLMPRCTLPDWEKAEEKAQRGRGRPQCSLAEETCSTGTACTSDGCVMSPHLGSLSPRGGGAPRAPRTRTKWRMEEDDGDNEDDDVRTDP